MASLGSLVVSVTANIAEFVADLGKAAHEADIATAKMRKSFDEVGKQLEIMGAIAVGAFTLLTKKALENADQMLRLSQSTGMQVEAFSELAYAASLSHVNLDQLGTSLGRLSKDILETASDTGESRAAFTALGIQVKNTDGSMKTAGQVLEEVADKFERMQDGAAKAGIAIAIFGRGGADMIPLLNKGSSSLREAAEEARALGVALGVDAARSAQEFGDNLTKLESTAQSLARVIASPLIEKVNELVNQFVAARTAGLSFWQALSIASADKSLGTRIFELKEKLAGLMKLRDELSKKTFGNDISNAWFGNLDDVIEKIKETEKELATLETMNAKTHPFMELPPTKTPGPTLVDPNIAKRAALAHLDFLKAQATIEVGIFKDALTNKQTLLTLAYDDNRVSDSDYFAKKIEMAKSAAEQEKKITDTLLTQQRAELGKQKQGTAEYWNALKSVNETVAKGQKITTDLGMASLVNFEQAKKAADNYKRSIEQVNIQILQMQGQTAAAAAQQFELQNRDLRKKSVTAGDKSGVSDIDRLGELTRTQALFNEQREKLGRIDAALATQESLIYAQVKMGQVSALEGANMIAAARAQSIPDQQAVIALMGELAEASGNATLRLQAQQAATGMMTAATRDAGLAVAESVMTIQEIENISYQQRLVALQAFIQTYGVSVKAGQQLLQRLEIQHEAKMGSISAVFAQEARKFEELNAKEKTQTILGYLTTLSAGAAQKNRAMFELNKVASIANAIIYTFEGANKALSLGPWGIPLAAVIVAAGLANVASIASTSFGSGAPSGGGGSGAIPTTDVPSAGAPQGSGPGTTTIIELHGEGFSRKQIRELFSQLSEGGRDGGRVVLA